ncbi:hypothetical protein BH11BAC2_BH11BAC2_20620 [soil metagenome]
MRIVRLVFISILINTACIAQRVDNMWLQGYANSFPIPFGGSNLDFNFGAPNIYYDSLRDMQLDFTLGLISDSVGNLLFYSNGVWIADATNDTMQNGSGLNPSSYTTSVYNTGIRVTAADMLLPDPGNPNQYYLIHETPGDTVYPYPDFLYYSKIDKTLNNGKGKVISKNQVICSDTLDLGQVLACRHANGRDWWIVFPEYRSPNYYVYFLNPNGIIFHSKQSIGIRNYSSGQATFSPDGTKYASYDTYTDLEVFDFDRCTGVFSNPQNVSVNDGVVGFGVSFSPDSRIIYASSVYWIYQFDLDKPDIADYDTVAVWDSTYSPSPPFAALFFTQYLRPDGKIYVGTGNGTQVYHTIDYPDSSGVACNVSQHSVPLPTIHSNSCPTYINYYLGPVVGSVCDSLSVGLTEPSGVVNLNVSITPNPVINQFYLNYHLPGNKDGWLDLSDASGRIIVHRRLYWSTSSLLMYTANLKPGCYFARVTSDMGITETKRLMVLK